MASLAPSLRPRPGMRASIFSPGEGDPGHPGPADSAFSADARLVSEQFSQAPQKLAFYSWYGSARLFHFRVPPDTVLLRWLLQVSRGSGPTCTNVEITV